MQFLKHPLFFIATFALLFFLVNESFSYYSELQTAKEELYKKNKLILKNLTDAQAKNVEILAEILAVDKAVIKAYLEDKPEIIKEHIAPLWKKVKEKKLTHEIHFFKPPAISFVNFSDFKSIGKDVSSVRTDIGWITSSFKASSHALMCKTYAGYRATTPIYDENGSILGGLSLGKKIDWIPTAVKEKTEHESFLVYTKASTKSLAPKYYDAFIKNKEPIGNFILANRTFDITSEVLPSIDFAKDIQDVSINKENYTLFTYPIIDFNKKTLGYVCIVSQLKGFKEGFISTALKSFFIVLISVIIALLITRNRINSFLKEIKLIKNITNKIKKRDFTSLYDNKEVNKVSTEALVDLESDVLDMGTELARQYAQLEGENKKKSQELITQLYTDELTGLANRYALFRDLENSEGNYTAILNIRNFKEVNDAFGFESANYILKEIAHKYEPLAKEKGFTLYRVGSDEYVLTKFKDKSVLEFKKFVLEIINDVEKNFYTIENTDININIYAGICYENTKSLEKAGMALRQAKKYKKELAIYKPTENTKEYYMANIAIMNKVAKALSADDIIVYYQGIVDRDEKLHKYEALVRMRDGDKILSPYLFLDLSKQTKYYSQITKVVIKKTFAEFSKVDKSFSINLTAEDILNSETMSLIDEEMKKCPNPKKLVFELIESDDLYNLKEIHDFIQDIKSKGAKIAIDDFGTGYSNFSYMMKIEPDYLKIDGSIIKNLDTDENARKILRTIINFAQELNIKVIAEYVHSREIFEICKNLGVDEFQGYYFSEPAPL